jgi:hypothetical protein
MQKRYQVTVPLWMADYFDMVRELHPHLAMANIARLQISFGIIRTTEIAHPEYKSRFHQNERNLFKSFVTGEKGYQERILEIIDFEAQKAIRYRQDKGSLPRRKNA